MWGIIYYLNVTEIIISQLRHRREFRDVHTSALQPQTPNKKKTLFPTSTCLVLDEKTSPSCLSTSHRDFFLKPNS